MTIELFQKRSLILGIRGLGQAHSESPLIWTSSRTAFFWGGGVGARESFTSKGLSVDFDLIDGLAIVIYRKDELHLFSIVGLRAVESGPGAPPQKLEPGPLLRSHPRSLDLAK